MSLDSLQKFVVLSKCQSLALVFSLILVLHLMSASAGLQVVVWAGAELISIMRTGLNKHQTPDQRKCQRNFTEHNECQARHVSSKTPFYCESVFKLICQWQFNYQISITIQILVAFNKDNVNIVNCENYREMLLTPSQTSHTSTPSVFVVSQSKHDAYIHTDFAFPLFHILLSTSGRETIF